MKDKVFVYGSLLRGMHNHDRFLKGAKFCGRSKSTEGYTMYSLDGYFPAVLDTGIDDRVVGEVYEVGPRTLTALDNLEGHPTYYRRQRMETPYGNAWIYVYQHKPRGDHVKYGDWARYCEVQRRGI